MKYLLKLLFVFAIASTVLVSCKDDDEKNEIIKVPEIGNLAGASDLFNYTLNWTAFENVEKYIVYVDDTKIKTCSETSTSFVVNRADCDGDIAAGKHSIKVDGINNEGEVIATAIFDADIAEVTLIELKNLKGEQNTVVYTLKWDANETAKSYKLFIDDKEVKTCSTCSILLTVNYGDVEGDLAFGDHKFKVEGLSKDGQLIALAMINANIAEVTIESLENITSKQEGANFNVNWDANSEVKTYKVFVDNKEVKTCTENKTSLTVNHQDFVGDLSVGDHTIKIEGLDETGELIALAMIKASITEITVEILENLSGKQEGADFNINWDVNSNVKTYKVFVDNNETKTCTENKSSLIVSHDNIEGELSVGDHKIKVDGIDEAGIVVASANMDVSITEVPKEAFTNLKGIQNSDVFNIEWDDVENVVSYKLFIDGELFREGIDEKAFYIKTESTISAGELSAGVHTFLFQGLDNAGTAIFEGSFNATIVKAVVSETKPESFRYVIGKHDMELYWDNVEGAVDFTLQVNYVDIKKLIETNEASMTITRTENNGYKANIFMPMEIGKTVRFDVFAILADNKEGDAATINFTPEAPAAPTNLAVEVEEDGTCKLTWTASEDSHVFAYAIYNGDKQIADRIKATEYSFNPDESGTYNFTVKAISVLILYSEASNVVEVEVQAQIPGVEDIDYEFLQFTTTWRYALTWHYYKSNPEKQVADPESIIWFLLYEDDKEEPIRKLQIIGELQNDGRYKYLTTQLFYDSNINVNHTYSIVVEDRVTGAKSKAVPFKYYADDYK